MKCPESERLYLLRAGELSVNESQALESHRVGCANCQRADQAWGELLADLSATPALGVSAEEFTQGVLNACQQAPAISPRAPLVRTETDGRRRGRAWYGMGMVAAAAVLCFAPLWLSRSGSPSSMGERDLEQVTARGGEHAPVADQQAELMFLRRGVARPLAGAALRDGDGLAVRCSNRADVPGYLAVFAQDASGALHWIYPAYLDPDSNPTSIPIAARTQERALEEVVEPDGVSAGRFRVFALFTRAPLAVRTLEAQLAGAASDGKGANLTTHELMTRFDALAVQHWDAKWENEP